jgi:hypothetical protein
LWNLAVLPQNIPFLGTRFGGAFLWQILPFLSSVLPIYIRYRKNGRKKQEILPNSISGRILPTEAVTLRAVGKLLPVNNRKKNRKNGRMGATLYQ